LILLSRSSWSPIRHGQQPHQPPPHGGGGHRQHRPPRPPRRAQLLPPPLRPPGAPPLRLGGLHALPPARLLRRLRRRQVGRRARPAPPRLDRLPPDAAQHHRHRPLVLVHDRQRQRQQQVQALRRAAGEDGLGGVPHCQQRRHRREPTAHRGAPVAVGAQPRQARPPPRCRRARQELVRRRP
ncbi:Os01g0373500, partial [Oryza sativa Japonica Group]